MAESGDKEKIQDLTYQNELIRKRYIEILKNIENNSSDRNVKNNAKNARLAAEKTKLLSRAGSGSGFSERDIEQLNNLAVEYSTNYNKIQELEKKQSDQQPSNPGKKDNPSESDDPDDPTPDGNGEPGTTTTGKSVMGPISKAGRDIATKVCKKLRDKTNEYLHKREQWGRILPEDEVVKALAKEEEAAIDEEPDFSRLDDTDKALVRATVQREHEASVRDLYERSLREHSMTVTGDESYNISIERMKDLKPYVDDTKKMTTKELSDFLSRCVTQGHMIDRNAFINKMNAVAQECARKCAPSDATDNEFQYIWNQAVKSGREEWLREYDEIARTVKIDNVLPGETDNTQQQKKQVDQGMFVPSEWARTNVSFSGCDMVASAQMKTTAGSAVSVTMGSLQTLTYSIFRKIAPIYNIGNVNAKDYVGGPRTIAGSMVFTVFNQHWGTELIDQWARAEGYSESRKVLMDEIAPIDLTISMANEYGVYSRLAIYSVRLFSEGQVMSIQDIYTENTFQYVALNIDYLASINSKVDTTPKATAASLMATSAKKMMPSIKPANDGGLKTDVTQPSADAPQQNPKSDKPQATMQDGTPLDPTSYDDYADYVKDVNNDCKKELEAIEAKNKAGEYASVQDYEDAKTKAAQIKQDALEVGADRFENDAFKRLMISSGRDENGDEDR